VDGRAAQNGPAPATALAALVVGLGLALTACTSSGPEPAPSSPGAATPDDGRGEVGDSGGTGGVTLAFAGDVHFQAHLQRLLRAGGGGLGPITATLRDADVAMVNLETAVTERGRRDPKEREDPEDRYHFRTPPGALDVLADAGVDVVSVGNNHAGDYGAVGLADTLAAGRASGLAMVGAGGDRAEAFTPYRVTKGGIDLAFLAADSVFREGGSDVWAAGPANAGVAAARESRPRALLTAVRTAAAADDVVVVYLHWGREYQSCPTQEQRLLSRRLAAAGADVVVGSHTHVLGGAGWSGDTFVAYGLGNFVWYHDREPDTGVLSLRVDRDGVVDDAWTAARIAAGGRPRPVAGPAGEAAVADWAALRRCTGLGAERGTAQADDPAYDSSTSRIDPALAERLRASHRPGCPVPLRDLRYLRMTYRDFDGRARTGEMVVHRRWASGVTRTFGRLYDAGWPIARMRLVDDYGGDDDRSMAADNTSGYNCRPVAGQTQWSQHAYGAAIDLNPVENPYVRAGSVDPPAGRRFARVDRTSTAGTAPGVIKADDVVVSAFARMGWEWGGDWVRSQDFQHVAAPPAG
jgi:hypothetical protein